MSWGQNGVTIQRLQPEQSQVVSAGANNVLVPFTQLRNLGFLRGIRLRTPYKNATFTTGTTGLTAPTALQRNQLRQILNFQLILQGVASLYNVSGVALGDLQYVGSGKRRSEVMLSDYLNGYANTAAGSPGYPWQSPSPLGAGSSAEKYVPVVEYNHTGPVGALGYNMYIPLTEFMAFPSQMVQSGQGQNQSAVQTGDTELELGLLMMQVAQQNVTCFTTVASLYGADYRSVLAGFVSGYDTLAATQTWNLDDDFFDVDPNPANWPSAMQTAYAITRQEFVVPTSAQGLTYQFAQAGYLLRAIYRFYNNSSVYGTIVDIFGDATQTPDLITKNFLSGASVSKVQETAASNGRNCLDAYGTPPPGILVDDFLADGTATQIIDTTAYTDLRTVFAGLPTSITHVSVTEERMIPVKVAG